MADGNIELVLCEHSAGSSTLEIAALGPAPASPDSDLKFLSVRLRVLSDAGTQGETTMALATQTVAIEIPAKLLIATGGDRYRIRTVNELDTLFQEEWAALKDRVRRRLASPIEIDMDAASGAGLFGIKSVGTAKLLARFWLNPSLIDGLGNVPANEWLLRAEGKAAIDFTYMNAAGQGLKLTGRLLAKLTLRKSDLTDWIDADFGFDLPEFPGFDLKMPTVRLPKLAFPKIDIDFPDLPSSLFSLSLPPIIEQLAFKWTKQPQLVIELTDGVLNLHTKTDGAGTFFVAGLPLIEATDVALNHADGKFEFTAKLDSKLAPIQVPDKILNSPAMPFIVSLSGNTLTPAFTDIDLGGGQVLRNARLAIEFKSEKIVISAKDDPALFIALTAAVVIDYDPATKKTKTKFKELAIIEPYPIELLARTAEAFGEFIRLVAAIPLPSMGIPNVDPSGVLKLLERIGKLLVAAAKWLAEQAGKAAGLLAGMVEAVFEALLQLVSKLAELGKDAITHIAIEVRLDPKTYRLRQIVIMPVADEATLNKTMTLSALGFDFTLSAKLRPALVIDLGPESWTGLVVQPANGSQAILATDLWLDKETSPQQAMGSTDETGAAGSAPKRLIELKATPAAQAGGKLHDIVVAAIQHGRPRFFQAFSNDPAGEKFDEILQFDGKAALAIREIGVLHEAAIKFKIPGQPDETYPGGNPVFELTLEAPDLKKRLLALLAKADAPADGGGDSFFDKLKQKVEITSTAYGFVKESKSVALTLGVKVHIGDDFAPETELSIAASLRDLSMKITGGEKIFIYSQKDKPTVTYHPLGLDLTVSPKAEDQNERYKQFFIDLSHGSESLGLAEEAKALLSYGKVSSSGKGLQFEVPTFSVGRAGFDLEARILPEPVKLGGVDVPFRFTSGQVAIKGSKFGGGALAGSGQLPQALVGEANASIALQLGASDSGGVIVKGATARLDKSGDPIRCSSTRFELTITELGFDYVLDGSYHFYFLLTGNAVFKPGGGEYATGLLKNFKDITIKLDKAPLAADPRVLMRSISFQVKVDPPKKMSFFDIFNFELRGFGFHPASPKFDDDPAMSISGQVKFMSGGDKISPSFDFHSMWIAAPKKGSAKPRVRFDGLTVGLRTGAVDVEGTAIAVDGSMPDLYRPNLLPADVTAEGFLASGRLDIDGWASMSAAMGFLELRKKNQPSKPRHSFFLYGQMEKLAEPIDTPVGRIYLREFGFGFGYRYTLAGIAQAETAKTPQELVKVLDNVSKYQGSLNTFPAWEPTYDNDDLTLALRGMFALSAASDSSSYDAKKEAGLPNPLLFDIVAAFRTDFTFLINLRAWVSVNYNDWLIAGTTAPWKSNPTMRGYLYFSVPRKEFLGRFISDGKGHVGEHPKLPAPLASAIKNTQFSATLYIRPGLFHAELGWPYELGFEFGKPGDTFHLKLTGGLIHRIEDFALLNGIAFKAIGSVYLEGRVGGSSLGAAAVARANFSIEARVLSYLSLKDLGDSFYYGYMRIDVSVGVSIQVWLSFKIFGKRITLSASFSLHLAVSIALEAVIGPELLGGRAHVSIGVRAFGRSLSVGIGLSFNNDKLAIARAKVARFMELGLATAIPDKAQDGQRIEKNPKPEPPRSELAGHGDAAIEDDIGSEPLPPPAEEEGPITGGRAIGPTDFWAMLFPTRAPEDKADAPEWYVMQLVPRDHTARDYTADGWLTAMNDPLEVERATFFASPKNHELHQGFTEPGHRLEFDAELPMEGKPYLAHLGWKGEMTDVALAPSGQHAFGMNLEAAVAAGDGETLYVGQLLQSLFLGIPKEDGKDGKSFDGDYEEPSVRHVDPYPLAMESDATASAKQLARIGRSRSNLTGKAKREAEIEETRSAIISAVAETASAIAASGQTAQAWGARSPEIDARDFGLTFVINRSAINVLFTGDAQKEPPIARFTIVKSDVDAASKVSAGKVELYNPPERMFRVAQPKFTPTHVIDQQGIKLNWDLEPDWGASQGVYGDPEFHLKHYRIRRSIRGIPGKEFCAEFLVKAGSPIEYKSGGLRFLRPDFQFIDDLRKQELASGSSTEDFPDILRKLLLGQATDAEWTAESLGVSADKVGDIEILYEIVPVDTAGTSDFGQLHVVNDFRLIETLPISPREVTLQVAYAAMPTHVAPGAGQSVPLDQKPRLRILLKPAVRDDVLWPNGSVYLLRIWRQDIAPSGSYGSDAVDVARGRPDQDAIDRLRKDSIQEFLLSAKLAAVQEEATLVAEYWPPGAETPDLQPCIFSIHAVPPPNAGLSDLGPALKIENLLSAMGVSNDPVADRKAYRLFITNIHREGKKVDAARRGEWKTVAFNLIVEKRDPKDSARPDLTAISSAVEILEQPVHYEFQSLERSDMRVESGRVIVMQPAADAQLEALVNPGADETPFQGVRDGQRRTATRLEWNAYPASLKLTTGSAIQHNAIGGYDVFCVDPDALPGRGSAIEEAVALAQPMGRVALLPREMDGLDPAGFGDFGRIESAYPSDTLRLQNAGKVVQTSGTRKTGWYSAAESAAVFPEPSIRRSLMPDPDEGLIAALFSGGTPEAIRVSIPVWRDTKEPPLGHWSISEFTGSTGWGEYASALPRDNQPPAESWQVTFKPKDGFSVAALRRLLQNLRLAPDDTDSARSEEQRALQRRLNEPDYLASVGVVVEALRQRNGAWLSVASQEHSFDLMPALHPIIGDALAFISYDAQSGNMAAANGKIYRRYALAPDANPEITTTEFLDYVDEVPAERDPYGWGALRTLGLAAGFRLYDTETGDYVRFGQAGGGLAGCIQAAIGRALSRYADAGRDNGQPFVDILTQPWGNVRLSWFDGGHRDVSGAEDLSQLQDEMLAVVQIALRPHPDRLMAADAPVDEAGQGVRYFALTTDASRHIPEGLWKIAIAPQSYQVARFDVLSVSGGIVAQKPMRLSKELPTAELYEPRPPRLVEKDNKRRIVAIIRAAITSAATLPEAFPDNDLSALIVTSPDGGAHKWIEIDQPTVLDALSKKQIIGEERAFGKFENLSGLDWGDVLFRPSEPGKEVTPRDALNRLAHYAGKRFAPLAIPVVKTDQPSAEEQAEATRMRGEMADRIVRFWSRFIEHCAPAWGRPGGTEPTAQVDDRIFLSLGTVADPGQWRRAPGLTGTVAVTMVDVERRGARRKFAVRPFGRYEAWSKAAPDKMTKSGGKLVRFPLGVSEGLAEMADGMAQFIDATLPRTEPLEKPVILSSVTHAPENGLPGRFELVVAHGSDMVLAQANRRNAALLAPLDISVGFWREFAHMPWLTVFQERYKIDLNAMGQFGSLDARLDLQKLAITREVAARRLANLRQRVPDAWLGSTMISATHLPYFFRVHALVHATAGIVVSEQVATTFEEGFFDLAWPFATGGFKGRELTDTHRYSVARRPKSDQANETEEITIITFDLAALRFIDCMVKADAELWFGEGGELWPMNLKRVGHLPEPGVSYRIAVETPLTVISGDGAPDHEEVLARTQEIDVLPNLPGQEPDQPLYLLQQSGPRFTPGISVDENGAQLPGQPLYGATPALQKDDPQQDRFRWRIPVPVQLAQEPAAVMRRLDKPHIEPLKTVIADLPAPHPGTTPAIAGMHEVSLIWTGAPEQAKWQAALAALASVGDCPEAYALLTPLAASAPATGELSIILSPKAVENKAVRDALSALTGGDPAYGDITTLVLRRPPRDAELGIFEHHGPGDNGPAAELKLWVLALAQEQLFGAGRRPAAIASKGTRIPIVAKFLRQVGS